MNFSSGVVRSISPAVFSCTSLSRLFCPLFLPISLLPCKSPSAIISRSLMSATSPSKGSNTAPVAVKGPYHEKVEVLHSAKWLQLKRIHYKDVEGNSRTWDVCHRTTRRGNIDAVAILAILHKKGKDDEIVLVKQYRPPLDLYTIETPAGLVDDGEDASTTALRELREETGYVGEVKYITPAIFPDPGLTNASFCYVVVDIDGDAPENQNPAQDQQSGEHIEIVYTPKKTILEFLTNLSKDPKIGIDAKLYSYAMGIAAAAENEIAQVSSDKKRKADSS